MFGIKTRIKKSLAEYKARRAEILDQKQLEADFWENYHFFEKNETRFEVSQEFLIKCMDDIGKTTSFDYHYTYHTAWAARKLSELMPKKHVDISSLTYFSTIMSSVIPIEFYDFRPAKIELSNFSCKHADITQLPFSDGELESLSCMHVLEHIGLGRYGDPIDLEGDLKAISELKRVTRIGGVLLLVVPVGKDVIAFNAHRVYSYAHVMKLMSPFELIEFSLVTDSPEAKFVSGASKQLSDLQAYGCGCFLFKKIE